MARCARVFYEDHKRSPYVYQRRMNTDPNVHISVEAETVPFERVISKYLSSRAARRRLLDGLTSTTTMAICYRFKVDEPYTRATPL